MYLEDDSGKRSIPLQSIRGRNASLGAAPQLLHSLAHHPPEPVYHQAGREVTPIQRLRRAQRGDRALTWARRERGEMNAGFLHKDQIYQTHQAMKITAGRLLFCKPESTHSRLTSSRWSLMGPERVAVPFLTHLFIFTRAASLSRLVQYNSFTHNPEFQNKTKKNQ